MRAKDFTNRTYPIRPLSSNPNRANQSQFRSEPKDMPDRSSSKNPYINDTKDYNRSRKGILCVKCGYVGHTSKECTGDVLPAWQQAYEAWCLVMFFSIICYLWVRVL